MENETMQNEQSHDMHAEMAHELSSAPISESHEEIQTNNGGQSTLEYLFSLFPSPRGVVEFGRTRRTITVNSMGERTSTQLNLDSFKMCRPYGIYGTEGVKKAAVTAADQFTVQLESVEGKYVRTTAYGPRATMLFDILRRAAREGKGVDAPGEHGKIIAFSGVGEWRANTSGNRPGSVNNNQQPQRQLQPKPQQPGSLTSMTCNELWACFEDGTEERVFSIYDNANVANEADGKPSAGAISLFGL